MTITRQGPGALLLFSPEAHPPRPLTGETLLPLVRTALARAGLPLPSSPELRVFLSPRGALLLVRPGFGGPPEKIFWPSS